jgi:hypothetical protein
MRADVSGNDQFAMHPIRNQCLIEEHRFVRLLADILRPRDGVPVSSEADPGIRVKRAVGGHPGQNFALRVKS